MLQVQAKVGELATPSADPPLVLLGDLSALRVRAELDERDLVKIRVGKRVVVRADAFRDREFEGRRPDRSRRPCLLNVLAVARETGALVQIHAENYDAIRFLTDRLERGGQIAPKFHATSRPIPVEREATHRAITLAELVDVPIVIVHVSNREAMEEIRRAQIRGLTIYGETCPQYLVLTEKDLNGLGMEGAKYVCSPPPRDEASQQACWEGITTGVFSLFSSDHCPFRYEDPHGKLHPKARTSFRWVPNGIPGVETRLPILFSEGVSKGRIDLSRFVALAATNHAKLYGLYPRKGTIAVGSDADIVLWDPAREQTISQKILHHGADYTPYEGLRVKGWPTRVMLRGKTIVEDGRVLGNAGDGAFLERERSNVTQSPERS